MVFLWLIVVDIGSHGIILGYEWDVDYYVTQESWIINKLSADSKQKRNARCLYIYLLYTCYIYIPISQSFEYFVRFFFYWVDIY